MGGSQGVVLGHQGQSHVILMTIDIPKISVYTKIVILFRQIYTPMEERTLRLSFKMGNAQALEKGAMSGAFFESYVFSEIPLYGK